MLLSSWTNHHRHRIGATQRAGQEEVACVQAVELWLLLLRYPSRLLHHHQYLLFCFCLPLAYPLPMISWQQQPQEQARRKSVPSFSRHFLVAVVGFAVHSGQYSEHYYRSSRRSVENYHLYHCHQSYCLCFSRYCFCSADCYSYWSAAVGHYLLLHQIHAYHHQQPPHPLEKEEKAESSDS